jgi:single-stranded-DNA-specific exonuclease
MKKWIEPQETVISPSVQKAVGGHPLVAHTVVRRGISEVGPVRAFLNPDLYQPQPPTALPNMAAAADRVERAIQQQERICVWGDFDVDGQTSTTLLLTTMKELGGQVEFYIPSRQESHGIHLEPLKELIGDGVSLIVTCDTGVTAHDPIVYALEQGTDVIVTDHHDLPTSLPPAHAILNPKMLPSEHPLRELPGVGCAYKLAEELYRRAGRSEDAESHLDLVALGIVADIAVQVGDVRYLLQRGLQALRRGGRLGLDVLMEEANMDPRHLTEDTIGYYLGPRLNSLGRLGDARDGVSLLMTQDKTEARYLASQVEGLNAQRRTMSEQMLAGAREQIEHEPSLLDYSALVLSSSAWSPGIVGLVASRLAEEYRRPAILISAPPGEMGRGSARSVEGCDIHQAIAEHASMLVRFGGHPMAAGLTIAPERIGEFRRALSGTVQQMLTEEAVEDCLQVDGYLDLDEISLELVQDLRRLAPFGPGNPPLTLATRELSLASERTIGGNNQHRLLIVEDQAGSRRKALWWWSAALPLPDEPFDLAFSLGTNEYRGEIEVQLEWIDARSHSVSAVPIAPTPALKVVDLRNDPTPHETLDRLRAERDVLVWAEAAARNELAAADRRELAPNETLAVWTIPPDPIVLQAALTSVSPSTLYLFGADPRMDSMTDFLERLAGLTKRALKAEGGATSLSMLAAATAQRQDTVVAGLQWLASQGHITIDSRDEDSIYLRDGTQSLDGAKADDADRLRALLEETAAYRAHYMRADPDSLVQLPPSSAKET